MINSTFIIAEAGVNHNGSLELAKQLVDVAVDAGADAIKFQTFKSDKLVKADAPKAEYQIKNTNNNENQIEMLKRLELSKESHFELLKYCNQKGIQFLSTPFDMDSLDFLIKDLNLPILKISSGDINNGPLLLQAAQAQRKIILSSGTSTLADIEAALQVLSFGYLNTSIQPNKENLIEAYSSQEGQAVLQEKVSLLHCTTEYPASPREINLNAMQTLKSAFGLNVGMSDHSEGIHISIASVALGAKVLEKHITLDKELPGPDHKASITPEELKLLVTCTRDVEVAMGNGLKIPFPSEIVNKSIVRKSLVASKPIQIGEEFTSDNITAKRPGNGVSPMHYWAIMGKTARKNYDIDDTVEL